MARPSRGGMFAPTRRLYGATAVALFLAGGAMAFAPALAQESLGPQVASDSQMLLEADTLIFDNDADTVTAEGGVQIDYGGNRLVARRVTYDRRSGRLMAAGDVEIVDRDGNHIFTDQIDVTDDFGDGFINALRVETPDKTYFGAESAKREGGNLTTFNNGVYTACEPCEENPQKPPIWRVRSQQIVWNQQKKTIRFNNARFELFGLPLAYFPYLEVPDHTVKRKTGFLMPGIKYKSDLGAGLTIPFYIALSPTYDLTLRGTGYTKQGFLGEAEWRQQFNNGQYNLKVAGIRQMNPDSFDLRTVDRGYDTADGSAVTDLNRTRLMFATKGDFKINPRWSFGWDVLVQSDKNFAYTYGINGYSDYVHTSNVHLTGLNERNYFDLRAMRFQVQESFWSTTQAGAFNRNAIHERQPWALPSFDYSWTAGEPVAGGELNIDINSRVLYRERLDQPLSDTNGDGRGDTALLTRGLEGTNGRVTGEVEWKRSYVTPAGLVLTPMLHGQADATFLDVTPGSLAAINTAATNLGVAADVRASYYRYMASAGLEARWPILFSTTSATHILEPVAQLFVRPDERYAETLDIPNEDAQSMVFDATSLFERDKFSGYDRIEGGTRANLGLRYSGSYANGWSSNAIFGQSFHLAGLNSYAATDYVSVGAFSGLESDRSDYVGLVGVSSPGGVSLAAAGRFDEESFEMRRGELRALFTTPLASINTQYAYIQAQPLYGFPNDRHQITVGAAVRFSENWRAYTNGTYDLQNNVLVQDSYGVSYADECFVFGVSMTQTRNANNSADVTRSFGFTLSMRTLGDFGSNTASFDQ